VRKERPRLLLRPGDEATEAQKDVRKQGDEQAGAIVAKLARAEERDVARDGRGLHRAALRRRDGAN
jgi:hypothetical protein